MEKLELEIIDIDDKGRGVAKNEGKIYFVENAKYGQIIEAEIIEDKKSYSIAKLLKIIKESEYLVDTGIKENQLCGIFDLYDLDYKKQVELKKDNLLNTVNRLAKENLEDVDFIEAKDKYYYRNKLELKLSPQGKISNFERNSNSFIETDDCVMVTKQINRIISKLQELIDRFNVRGYDPKTNKGIVKNIIIRSSSLSESMCIFVLNREVDLGKFYLAIEAEGLVDSLFISINSQRNNYKIKNLIHIFGKEKIQEDLAGFRFNISPRAFFQVNKDMAYEIYMLARNYIKGMDADLIVDLYSGVSTTSIILSDLAEKIISVEINEDAVNDAKENAQLNGIDNIEWYPMHAEKAIEKIDFGMGKTVDLFDPPRKGLYINIVNKIGGSKIN